LGGFDPEIVQLVRGMFRRNVTVAAVRADLAVPG